MVCPRCRLRLSLSRNRPEIRVPSRRAFHTSSSHRALGAFTYPQEWQTGTYHFNKANQKTYPVAAQHTDKLLNQWLTQQKKRNVSDKAAYQLMLRSSVAAQRRKTDRIFISKTTAKDFGDRVEVNAFIYDGAEAASKENERKKKARMGARPDGGEQGGRRRRPTRLRALSSGDGTPRSAGPRRPGGTGPRGPSLGFRRVNIGTGAGTRAPVQSPAGGAPRGLSRNPLAPRPRS